MELAGQAGAVRRPQAPLHPGPALGRAAGRPAPRARQGDPDAVRRPALADRPALGLRVSHPLSAGFRSLRGGSAAPEIRRQPVAGGLLAVLMDGKEPSSALGSRAGRPGDPFAPADIAARSSGLRRLRASLSLAPGDLLRDRLFRRLWLSVLIGAFGSQVTMLALPLTAAVLLHATPTQMGLLTAMEIVPVRPVLAALRGLAGPGPQAAGLPLGPCAGCRGAGQRPRRLGRWAGSPSATCTASPS